MLVYVIHTRNLNTNYQWVHGVFTIDRAIEEFYYMLGKGFVTFCDEVPVEIITHLGNTPTRREPSSILEMEMDALARDREMIFKSSLN
jgi:hypothetical protein